MKTTLQCNEKVKITMKLKQIISFRKFMISYRVTHILFLTLFLPHTYLATQDVNSEYRNVVSFSTFRKKISEYAKVPYKNVRFLYKWAIRKYIKGEKPNTQEDARAKRIIKFAGISIITVLGLIGGVYLLKKIMSYKPAHMRLQETQERLLHANSPKAFFQIIGWDKLVPTQPSRVEEWDKGTGTWISGQSTSILDGWKLIKPTDSDMNTKLDELRQYTTDQGLIDNYRDRLTKKDSTFRVLYKTIEGVGKEELDPLKTDIFGLLSRTQRNFGGGAVQAAEPGDKGGFVSFRFWV